MTIKRLKINMNRIYRAVASSTAIETGKPVAEIEAKLKTKKSRFADIPLA